jgi:hypothetical protein
MKYLHQLATTAVRKSTNGSTCKSMQNSVACKATLTETVKYERLFRLVLVI